MVTCIAMLKSDVQSLQVRLTSRLTKSLHKPVPVDLPNSVRNHIQYRTSVFVEMETRNCQVLRSTLTYMIRWYIYTYIHVYILFFFWRITVYLQRIFWEWILTLTRYNFSHKKLNWFEYNFQILIQNNSHVQSDNINMNTNHIWNRVSWSTITF